MTKEELCKYRKQTEAAIKAKVQGKKFKIDGLEREFVVYGTGINKAVGQSHKFFFEKNEALIDFEQTIKNAKYVGSEKVNKNREDILQHHYFEIIIKGEKSFINIREMIQSNELQFWTIKDSNMLKK